MKKPTQSRLDRLRAYRWMVPDLINIAFKVHNLLVIYGVLPSMF